MSNVSIEEKIKKLTASFPNITKTEITAYKITSIIVSVLHNIIKLAFNLLIVFCAINIAGKGIDLYMLRNGGDIKKILIEIIVNFSIMIPAIIIKNILLDYI